MNWLIRCQECCSRSTDENSCCLLGHFRTSEGEYDLARALQTVKTCRANIGQFKIASEQNAFISEQFRNCIEGTEKGKDRLGLPVFKMKYTVKPSGKSVESYEVCRRVFAYCWRLSENKIKDIAASMKISEFGYIPNYQARPLTEKTRHGKI